jgi:hypothetical protein
MPSSLRRRLVRAAGLLAASALAPGALHAQTAPAPSAAGDSLAFPRRFVKWVFTEQGDSAFAHAGPMLRESMKSAEGVNAMATRIAGRFGSVQGTDAEVQFDEGPLKVYIAVMRLSEAPEPAAWVVAYVPGTQVVERAAFTSASGVKSRYPQAKLP